MFGMAFSPVFWEWKVNWEVQLDSMADMVTCGVVPGIILAQLFVMAGNRPFEIPIGWPLNTVVEYIPWVFIGFLIPVGAAFRLASIQY